jgi:hypothetical protein
MFVYQKQEQLLEYFHGNDNDSTGLLNHLFKPE